MRRYRTWTSRLRDHKLLKHWRLALLFALVASGAMLSFCPWGCSPKQTATGLSLEGRIVRVRLMQAIDQVTLTASQPASYSVADAKKQQLNLPPNAPIVLTLGPSGWNVGGVAIAPGELTLHPAAIGSLAVNGVAYRGHYRIVPVAANKFDVVNDVDLDDYLMSVVSRELFASWHENAYRAQAVAARTYALYEKNFPRERRHWDVYADQRSQVYGGIPAETPKSRECVATTRGMVLAFGPKGNERIFKTYFSSCCGGVTQNVGDVFSTDAQIPPLSAQNVGTLCSISNRFNWGPIVISKQELTRRFQYYGAAKNRAEKNIALIQSIEIEATNPYRRPVRFRVTDARGNRYSLGCEELRWAANAGATDGVTLPSSFVENIINESDRIRFVGGHGFGHGVGLCQWCTEARARAGISWEDILLYAYPGARLVRAY